MQISSRLGEGVNSMQTLEEIIEQARHLSYKDRKQLIKTLEASLAEEQTVAMQESESQNTQENKKSDQHRAGVDRTVQDEFCRHYPHIGIAPDLLALVGIQTENSAVEDKSLIREQIFRRLAERRSWLT